MAMRDFIIMTSRVDYQPVKVDDILFLESLEGRTKIHLIKDELYVNHSMSYMVNQLGDEFIQCHRKYAVNTEKVTAFNKSELKIDQTIISLGRKYKQTFFESMLAKRKLI